MSDTFNFGLKADGRPFSFYCVDDSVFILKALKEMITSFGGNVIGASAKAFDAYTQIRKLEEPPDVITTDLSMPQIDGLELLPKLKALCPQTKVVVVSAVGKQETIKQSVLLGADQYILKPLDAEKVFKVLDFICHRDTKTNFGQERVYGNKNKPLNVLVLQRTSETAQVMHTVLEWFGCEVHGVTHEIDKPLLDKITSLHAILDIILIDIKVNYDILALVRKVISLNQNTFIIIMNPEDDVNLLRQIYSLDVYHKIIGATENTLFEAMRKLFPAR